MNEAFFDLDNLLYLLGLLPDRLIRIIGFTVEHPTIIIDVFALYVVLFLVPLGCIVLFCALLGVLVVSPLHDIVVFLREVGTWVWRRPEPEAAVRLQTQPAARPRVEPEIILPSQTIDWDGNRATVEPGGARALFTRIIGEMEPVEPAAGPMPSLAEQLERAGRRAARVLPVNYAGKRPEGHSYPEMTLEIPAFLRKHG